MIRWLPALAVRRPVTVVMAFITCCVLGGISLARIPLDMMPPGFDYPYIWAWVSYRDTTPLETSERIVRPMEEHLATVPGVKSMSSQARSSGGSVELELRSSTDMTLAYNHVVDRMERAMAELPSDVEQYRVARWNPADEKKIWLAITLPAGMEDPYTLVTERIQQPLERIPGVGQVEIWGVREKTVWIDLHQEALAAHQVDLPGLISRLQREDFQLAGGRLEGGEVRYVRSLARFDGMEELAGWEVAPGLRLADVAEVSFREEEDHGINRVNGVDAAVIGVMAESGANTVAVCRQVRAELSEIQGSPDLEGLTFFPLFDQGREIERSLKNLLDTALQGGAFALVVLFLFLREWRMTLLIAGSIPFSLMLTVVVLYATGGTLNLLSMSGMMLAVGMVVDNAIVVVETIFRRRHQVPDAETAAVDGTNEVGLAITLSTMTTMVVFLPVILMSGDVMFSFFMGALGFPVVWALGASLLVALVFTPLATTTLAGARRAPEARWLSWLVSRYQRLLRWLLSHRFDAAMMAVVMLALTILVPVKSVGCSTKEGNEVSSFLIRFEVPAAMTFTERRDVVDSLESYVEENRDRWGVDFTRTRMRSSGTTGWLNVELLERGNEPEGSLPRREIVDDVKEYMPELPGVSTRLGWGGDTMGGKGISITLRGDRPEVLERLSEEVARRLEVPGFLGVYPPEETTGGREIRLQVERDHAARHGLDGTSIGQGVAFAMRGVELTRLREGGREVRTRARFHEHHRQDLDALLDLPLASSAGSMMPIRAVVDPEVGDGWGTIRRVGRTTGLTLKADLDETMDRHDAYSLVEEALEDMAFPRGYGWEKGLDLADQQESDEARQLALLLSMVFVFLLMGVLFESFLLPLSIITTVPMALLGVFWTLFITGTPLDIMAGIGLVVLVGVVVNNGIVLVDLVTRLRRSGLERTDALLAAGQARFRPILMTAMTTFFGLLPMAIGKSSFLDVPYAPLARVVAGGLVTATLLTLFFVPLLYSLLDDLRVGSARWVGWVRAPKRERPT